MIVDGASLRDAIVRASAFVRAPRRGAPAVATEGVHVEYKDGYLDVVGTDGATLVRTAIPASHVPDGPVSLFGATLPTETKKTLEAVAVGPVRLDLTPRALHVEADGWPRWGMTPSDEYPDWRAVLDRVTRRTSASVDAHDLRAAFESLGVAKIPKKTHDTEQPILRVSLGATHHTNGLGVLLEKVRPLFIGRGVLWEHIGAAISGDASTASQTYQARYLLRAVDVLRGLRVRRANIAIPCYESEMLPAAISAVTDKVAVTVLVMPFVDGALRRDNS